MCSRRHRSDSGPSQSPLLHRPPMRYPCPLRTTAAESRPVASAGAGAAASAAGAASGEGAAAEDAGCTGSHTSAAAGNELGTDASVPASSPMHPCRNRRGHPLWE